MRYSEWRFRGRPGDVTRPFVEAVLEGRQPMTPARDALEVTRFIHAANRSAREQTAIRLN